MKEEKIENNCSRLDQRMALVPPFIDAESTVMCAMHGSGRGVCSRTLSYPGNAQLAKFATRKGRDEGGKLATVVSFNLPTVLCTTTGLRRLIFLCGDRIHDGSRIPSAIVLHLVIRREAVNLVRP